MDVIILFTIEYNYSRLIQHEMLKKPVTCIKLYYRMENHIMIPRSQAIYITGNCTFFIFRTIVMGGWM